MQIISNLYHNFPKQRIVLVTHSNAALNDLFKKILERNVDARHLLRLGAGEYDLRESLAAEGGRGQGETFTKHGRVQWCLGRRQELLAEVQRLGNSISSTVGDVGYTCETAEYFYEYTVKVAISRFEKSIESSTPTLVVSELFPFNLFFANAPDQPLFKGKYDIDIDIARGCITHIRNLFQEVLDYRALELLRTQAHRCDYILKNQVRIYVYL